MSIYDKIEPKAHENLMFVSKKRQTMVRHHNLENSIVLIVLAHNNGALQPQNNAQPLFGDEQT